MRTLQEHEHLLALDISLDHLDAALRDPHGTWIIPQRRYTNNWPGFQQLLRDLRTALAAADGEVHLTTAAESTANYWWHIFYHLSTHSACQDWHPTLALLNPHHVKRFRQAQPEADKDDATDAQLIGRYYESLGAKSPYTFQPRYLPLRQLSRAYFRLTHTLAAEKAYLLSIVYLLASDYDRLEPFSKTLGVTSGQILSEYPDIQALAQISLDTLIPDLVTWSHNHLKDPAHNARRLHQVAHQSYPLPAFLAPTVHAVFEMTLAHVRFLEDHQRRYKRWIAAALEQLPEADLALAESGLGPILVGGCLGEIQDPRRFTTGRKYDRRRKRWRPRTYRDGQAGVANLAGLWWPRRDSGRTQGDGRRLARERNPYLRYWFVQAAYTLKGNRSDYAAYYQRKKDESRHHAHKRALILTARKAVRLIFALLYKGQIQRLEEASLAT
jgi:transposase